MYISTATSNDKKKVYVWERTPEGRVLVTYDAPYDYFIEDHESKEKYRSVTGSKLRKVEYDDPYEFFGERKRLRERGIPLYESDISPELKILSDKYYKQPIEELNITFYDIEVDYDPAKGHAGSSNPYAPINSIALYHKHTDKSIVLAVPPKEGKWKGCTVKDLDHLGHKADICIFKDEKELLTKFIEEIRDTDIISGWNCLPVNASVWKKNEIVSLKEIAPDDDLHDSKVKRISPIHKKQQHEIHLANGMSIVSSKDHIYPTVQCSKERYTKFSNDNRSLHSYKDLSLEEIQNSTETTFLQVTLRDNTNKDVENITEYECYLAGLLYADGSLKNKNKQHGYTCYQSDIDFIENIAESEYISGDRAKGYSTYIRPKSELFHSLIYENNIKKINLNMLSKLSKRQFYNFLSGILDGDGWLTKNTPSFCCYNSTDLNSICDLLLWNGIFFCRSATTVRLVDYDPTLLTLTLKKASRWKTELKTTLCEKNNSQKARLTKFKRIHDTTYLVRVTGVTSTGEMMEMMDIETNTHYFVSAGIQVHNCAFFDDPYIYFRLMKAFGKDATRAMNFPEVDQDVGVIEVEQYGSMEINVKPVGRVWIDFMEMVKKFDANQRSSYSLEAVAEEELDDMEKLDYGKSLYRLYREDFDQFVKYNIRDTEILKGLDLKFKYMNLAINFSHMVTNRIPSVLTTVSTSDTAILNFCKHELPERVVLPDAPYFVDEHGKKFEGAFVVDPQVGLHEWISSVDIKSLYPSAMRALNISPETLIGQFFENDKAYEHIMDKNDIELTVLYENGHDATLTAAEWSECLNKNKWSVSAHGTIFDQSYDGIIPSILTSWFEDRIEHQKLKAEMGKRYEETGDLEYKKKQEYYDNIQYLKKIQLNSMYGVFGNKYFRFFDVRMAESTTKTGREILLHMGKRIAESLDGEYKFPSESILYGDTDSVSKDSFVELNGELKPVEEWFNVLSQKHGYYSDENGKEIIKYNESAYNAPCYDPETKTAIDKEILTIYRHKVKKTMYKIELENGKTVTVTADHSLVVERDNKFITITAEELNDNDIFITF